MFRFAPAALLAVALALPAAAQHAVCADEASAQAYLDSFATDMTAAAEAGRLDTGAMRDIQTTLNALTEQLSSDDFGAFCKGLDELRAAYKF